MNEPTQLTDAEIWTGQCALRDQATKALTALLPGFILKAANVRNEWNKEQLHCVLHVTNDRRVNYSLRFNYAPVRGGSGFAYSRRNRRRVFTVTGDSYDAIGTRRRTTPYFEQRKDGSYNFEALAANIREALERKVYEFERNEATKSNVARSQETFATVRDALKLKPREYDAFSGLHEAGDFTIAVRASDYRDGKVRVEVRLKNEYLTGEEAIAMIRKLEAVK